MPNHVTRSVGPRLWDVVSRCRLTGHVCFDKCLGCLGGAPEEYAQRIDTGDRDRLMELLGTAADELELAEVTVRLRSSVLTAIEAAAELRNRAFRIVILRWGPNRSFICSNAAHRLVVGPIANVGPSTVIRSAAKWIADRASFVAKGVPLPVILTPAMATFKTSV